MAALLRPNRALCLAAVPFLAYYLMHTLRLVRRRPRLPPLHERVLILGASSGIGRSIAHLYAARGARICILARRQGHLDVVRAECEAMLKDTSSHVMAISADFSDPSALINVRDTLLKEWNGLDTLIVNAGVSSLQPLLAIAGVDRSLDQSRTPDLEGLARLHDISNAALKGNFIGPLLSMAVFIPLLAKTSAKPAILLVSSVAAVIPAPTRTLYAATKAASLILFQALSIEHPNIKFTAVLPSTVEGSFRASAVDSGIIREKLSKCLKREYVAEACIHAIDSGSRTVWLPWYFSFAHILYWFVPGLVDHAARRKYNFWEQ